MHSDMIVESTHSTSVDIVSDTTITHHHLILYSTIKTTIIINHLFNVDTLFLCYLLLFCTSLYVP